MVEQMYLSSDWPIPHRACSRCSGSMPGLVSTQRTRKRAPTLKEVKNRGTRNTRICDIQIDSVRIQLSVLLYCSTDTELQMAIHLLSTFSTHVAHDETVVDGWNLHDQVAGGALPVLVIVVVIETLRTCRATYFMKALESVHAARISMRSTPFRFFS